MTIGRGGKCALKALQYMSLGIPAVCSDVGANRDVVKHGENGFLAKTNEDWLNALKKLVDDEKLRKQLGDEARRTVVENYSMEKCAQNFARVVFDTAENKNIKRKNKKNVKNFSYRRSRFYRFASGRSVG